MTNKSGEKTSESHTTILEAMKPDIRYKSAEFESIIDVKESRVKELLSDLYEQGKIETTGSTKEKCIENWINKISKNKKRDENNDN